LRTQLHSPSWRAHGSSFRARRARLSRRSWRNRRGPAGRNSLRRQPARLSIGSALTDAVSDNSLVMLAPTLCPPDRSRHLLIVATLPLPGRPRGEASCRPRRCSSSRPVAMPSAVPEHPVSSARAALSPTSSSFNVGPVAAGRTWAPPARPLPRHPRGHLVRHPGGVVGTSAEASGGGHRQHRPCFPRCVHAHQLRWASVDGLRPRGRCSPDPSRSPPMDIALSISSSCLLMSACPRRHASASATRSPQVAFSRLTLSTCPTIVRQRTDVLRGTHRRPPPGHHCAPHRPGLSRAGARARPRTAVEPTGLLRGHPAKHTSSICGCT
jgi:hypothetical protein